MQFRSLRPENQTPSQSKPPRSSTLKIPKKLSLSAYPAENQASTQSWDNNGQQFGNSAPPQYDAAPFFPEQGQANQGGLPPFQQGFSSPNGSQPLGGQTGQMNPPGYGSGIYNNGGAQPGQGYGSGVYPHATGTQGYDSGIYNTGAQPGQGTQGQGYGSGVYPHANPSQPLGGQTGQMNPPGFGSGIYNNGGVQPGQGTQGYGSGIYNNGGAQPGQGYGSGVYPHATGTQGLTLPGGTGILKPLNVAQNPTSSLTLVNPGGQGTGTMKLAQSVKVVQVPVANQPGRYVTGFLPVLPQAPEEPEFSFSAKVAAVKHAAKNNIRLTIALIMAFVIITSSIVVVLFHTSPTEKVQHTPYDTTNTGATSNAQGQSNVLLADALKDNGLNWPVGNIDGNAFSFKDGAYHIAVNDQKHSAAALLPNETYGAQLTYTITLDEVKGDDTSEFNWFGVILRYSEYQKSGKTMSRFYIFSIDPQTKEYRFHKYDSGTNTDNPFSKVWSHGFGKEYHAGQGAKNQNTLQISSNGNKFTFVVNGKQVGTAQDSALAAGQIGMLVNEQGTEIAFSNLLLSK